MNQTFLFRHSGANLWEGWWVTGEWRESSQSSRSVGSRQHARTWPVLYRGSWYFREAPKGERSGTHHRFLLIHNAVPIIKSIGHKLHEQLNRGVVGEPAGRGLSLLHTIRHVHWFNWSMLCVPAQLYPTLCDPMDCSPPGSSVHGDSPGKNTGVGCHALLQGIFLTQGLNPGLLHCRQILYCLSHQVSTQ